MRVCLVFGFRVNAMWFYVEGERAPHSQHTVRATLSKFVVAFFCRAAQVVESESASTHHVQYLRLALPVLKS